MWAPKGTQGKGLREEGGPSGRLLPEPSRSLVTLQLIWVRVAGGKPAE